MTNDELRFDLQALIDKYGLANATKEQLLVVAILTTVNEPTAKAGGFVYA